jgi:serine phosphatase RsbU (regulator of sigma subunit)/DNA-binding phage protein
MTLTPLRSHMLQRVWVAAVASIAGASLLLPLNWRLPNDGLAHWLAFISLRLGDTAAVLACVLAVILCWRQPLGRPARDLAAFLAYLVLAFSFNTRMVPIPESLMAPAMFGSLILAGYFWIEFCDHFPREFRTRELPASFNRAEPLGILSSRPTRASAHDTLTRLNQSSRRLLGLSPVRGGFPRRFIDADGAQRLLLVVAILYAPQMFLMSQARFPIWVVLIAIGAGVALLRLHYSLSNGPDRRKILWIVEGTLFGVLAIPAVASLAGLLFLFFPIRQLAPFVIACGLSVGMLCFVACLYIGIFKDGALDPSLVIRKTALFSIVTAFILGSYLVLVGGVGSLLLRFAAIENQSVVIFSTVTIAALFLPVKNRAQSFVDRRLFRKKYEYPMLLELIKRTAVETTNPEGLSEIVAQLQRALSCENIVVFVKSVQSGVMSVAAAAGIPESARDTHLSPESLLGSLRTASHPSAVGATESASAVLSALGCALLVPITSSDRTLGLISLGRKPRDLEYDAEDVEFLTAVADQLAASLIHQEVRTEQQDIVQASEIQQALLPRELPQCNGFDISGTWLPARNVGGDYYDVFSLGKDKIAICIGDVCGKGMPAALLMANTQAAVRSFAGQVDSPADLCRKVNGVLSANLVQGRFVTFFYGIIDTAANRLIYTCAGHNPPILLRQDGSEERLATGGTVVGLFPEWDYQEAEVKLTGGDRLVLFTDGVTEAVNGAGEEFGEERLVAVVKRESNGSASQLQRAITRAVTEHCSGTFQDDVTLLVVQLDRNTLNA